MRIPQIKDILPITNGLFQHMNYTFRAEVSKQQLDYLLVATVGRRNPAPVIELLREEGDDEFDFLDDAQLTSLAGLMLSYYKPKWDKLARIYDIEYDPIHNYLDQWEDEADEENENTRTLDSDRVDTFGTTVSHSSTRTDNLSETETRNLAHSNTRTDNTQTANTGTQENAGTRSDTDSRWGFNSATAVNTDSNSASDHNTRTDNLLETHTGTVGDAGTDTGSVTIANTGTQGITGSDGTTGTNSRATDDTETNNANNHREREGRHFGNIGNLTSQKQLQEEIELWRWNYIESILDDAKEFLTLLVYV